MKAKNVLTVMLALLLVASIFMPAVDADDHVGIGLDATIKEPVPDIAISVDVEHIGFGELSPGETSASHPVNVTNVGTAEIDVTAEAFDAEEQEEIFGPGLLINGAVWREYSATLVADAEDEFAVALHVPETVTATGHIGGSLVVYAEKHIPVEAWELFQGNQQLNGYYDGATPDDNATKWISDAIDAKPSSSVTIAEGKVFVYCFNETEQKSYLAALYLSNGTLAWREECAVSNIYGSWATPAYHDGLVFIHGSPARHASDGTPAWPEGRYLPDNTNGGPMIAEGKVFIGNWDGHKYFAFDEKTGQELWNITVSGNAQGTPAYHDGKVFLTSYMSGGGHVYCVNADDGTGTWYAPISQYTCGSPCVAGGYVYVTTYEMEWDESLLGSLICLYESNGTEAWSQPVQRSDGTPAVHDGRVYVTGGCYWVTSHQTYCFDALTGEPIWSTDPEDEIGGWTCSAVVSADGKLFVGQEGPWWTGLDANYLKLFALDVEDGTVLWEAENGGATVAIHDGVVFTAGIDGRIYAYGPTEAPSA